MTAQLYTAEEMDLIATDAATAGMDLAPYVEHLEELCVGHAAALICRPELRPPSLATMKIQTRVTTLALLEVIDALLANPDSTELRVALAAKAEVHIAAVMGEI